MMRKTSILLTACLLAFCTFISLNLNAQRIVSLDKGDLLGLGSDLVPGDILVGQIPANSSSKPVLVFIHGYTGDAYTWLSEGNNDMFQRVFNDGYRAAYVTVYPDQSMWVNGSLFKEQIDVICNYYGVNNVVVVGHSKGGLDSDAALIHYGAVNQVSRVITLGSPHFGSPLANLAQSGWVWWLSAVFGQRNDATYVLQTGYMDYFRSITDSHPNNAQADFTTLGGWDYGGILWFSGVYLNGAGYGKRNEGNDGVVPYKLARRPGGKELFSGHGDARTKYDHFEINQGRYVWNYIKSEISDLNKSGAPLLAKTTSDEINHNAVVRSRSIILTSQKGRQNFVIDPGVEQIHMDVRQAKSTAKHALQAPSGWKIGDHLKSQPIEKTKDQLLGNFSKNYQINQPVQGSYSFDSEEAYVAMIHLSGGGYMEFSSDLNDQKRVYNTGENMRLQVRLVDHLEQPIKQAKVKGILRYTSDLKGSLDQEWQKEIVFFPGEEPGLYFAQSGRIDQSGIYNISIGAKAGLFQRSLVHSMAVVEGENTPQPERVANPLQVFPNPAQHYTQIQIDLKEEKTLEVSIFDLQGNLVQSYPTQKGHQGAQYLDWYLYDQRGNRVQPGLYVIEIKGEDFQERKRVLVR